MYKYLSLLALYFSSQASTHLHFLYCLYLINTMVNIIPYVASLLALGQAVAAAKTITSFSEWVDDILANPNGENMTPEEVLNAYESGQFSTPPSGTTNSPNRKSCQNES
jgi:hypothetical protein